MKSLCLAIPFLALSAYAQPVHDTPQFRAIITDFRPSVMGATRFATATIRFENHSHIPVILGYVWGSGLTTDDRGNRYGIYGEGGVRGIGLINGRSVDAKFALAPGQGSDARFEFAWKPATRNDLFGSRFVDMELTVRELIPQGGGQVTLGREHVVHFANPGSRGGFSGAPPPGTEPMPAPAPAPAPAPMPPPMPPPAAVDHCAGRARCYDAGPFVAEVTQVTAAVVGSGRHHLVTLHVRFMNTSGQPIVLGYKAGSSIATDDIGNPYTFGRPGTHDTSVSGIGMVEGRNANTSFVLNPGQSSNASFGVIRFNSGGKQIGTAFTYDNVILDLEVLNGGQVREGRQYSMHFADLRAGGMAPAQAKGSGDSLKKLQGILGGKKK